MYRPREKKRDDRDFDTTSLYANYSGVPLSRDYSAHFFRWSFARRFIKVTDTVLEVGCGVERPLFAILCRATAAKAVKKYVGVDLNKLPPWKKQHDVFIGEFDFTKRWKELREHAPEAGYDVAINMEVIEHMKVEHGRKLLRGMHALLRPGGVLLLSTPCYDGKRHAANHIHEYTVPELEREVVKAGFKVRRRFGAFMDTKHIGKAPITDAVAPHLKVPGPQLNKALKVIADELSEYYDRNALSCFFAPLYPDHARNNLWVLEKPI